ncbi:serine/threonine-protein kinase [Streptomyces sp. NPDC006368]|uniref:serine/threonine-protein kinase n=1 Tax=Streptomyces sp. NPDC006368 TaxID=3156760 RepID=UPI0033B5363F
MSGLGQQRRVAGRYRLEARLGRGGMGTVWKAYDELLGRRVAVKEIHVDAGTTPHSSLREARAVARVHHPHVICVHDVVEEDGTPYIVMELVEGVSLAELLAVHGPVDAAEAARIGLALLGALRAAHALGVLHRDLKPANVLLEDGTGRVVLTDFGIAQLAGSTTLTERGMFVGSPEYTAPERMQGAQAGPETDLWSLGALLCAALTGQSPFHRDSLGGVLHAVVEEEVRPPEAAGPLLPVVRGLLERDPERRMGAAEAERLLEAYVVTGTTPLYERYEPAPGPRTASRRPRTRLHPPHAAPPSPYAPAGDLTAPITPAPGRTPHRPARTPVVAAAVVAAALAGAGAAGMLLLHDDPGEGGGSGPPPVTTVTATPQDGPSPTPAGPTPTGPAPSGHGPTRPAPSAPAPAQSAPVPAGYRAVSDPGGFSLIVPAGYVRSSDDKRVYYMSPDRAFRIGIRVRQPVDGGPLAAMRRADADGPGSTPGYRDAKVTPTTHNGLPAALREFTWDGFPGGPGPRRSYDICWDEGGRMYNVWVSAPVPRLDELKRHFDTVLDSFRVRHT